MATAACNFLQIPFTRNPNPSSSPISPNCRSLNPSVHPHRPFPPSLSLTRTPSPTPISSVSANHPWMIGTVESTDPTVFASDPSLRYANLLFFKSAYNVQIVVEENEHEEALLRRFRREVLKAGVIQECKRRRFFENRHDEKKRKARDAAKRNSRRRSGSRFSSSRDTAAASKKKPVPADDEDDNWEMPEGGIPY